VYVCAGIATGRSLYAGMIPKGQEAEVDLVLPCRMCCEGDK
jgi:hypothetical protein